MDDKNITNKIKSITEWRNAIFGNTGNHDDKKNNKFSSTTDTAASLARQSLERLTNP